MRTLGVWYACVYLSVFLCVCSCTFKNYHICVRTSLTCFCFFSQFLFVSLFLWCKVWTHLSISVYAYCICQRIYVHKMCLIERIWLRLHICTSIGVSVCTRVCVCMCKYMIDCMYVCMYVLQFIHTFFQSSRVCLYLVVLQVRWQILPTVVAEPVRQNISWPNDDLGILFLRNKHQFSSLIRINKTLGVTGKLIN